MINLAHKFALTLRGVQATRDDYENCCIDLGEGRLAYFETPFHPEWRYHCAVEIDGIVHDLWQDKPVPLKRYMRLIGSDNVSYPAEEPCS